jgi:hypothetical protein
MYPTAGIGFKADHLDEALAAPAAGLWFEVHAENYMVAGGPRLAMLDAVRAERPVSLHGVGLSLGSDADPDVGHLRRLAALTARAQPFLVSEHLAWSRLGGTCYPDLLPLPRSDAALARLVRNIDITQNTLRRQILIENPSHYIQLDGHDWSETAFLTEIARRSGCGLLIDVNNVHVSANNMGFDARAWLDEIPADLVEEVHLAGHTEDPKLGAALLIDSHDEAVAEPVWRLYADFIARIGARPTLIERDDNLPPFAELLAESQRAAQLMAADQEVLCA